MRTLASHTLFLILGMITIQPGLPATSQTVNSGNQIDPISGIWEGTINADVLTSRVTLWLKLDGVRVSGTFQPEGEAPARINGAWYNGRLWLASESPIKSIEAKTVFTASLSGGRLFGNVESQLKFSMRGDIKGNWEVTRRGDLKPEDNVVKRISPPSDTRQLTESQREALSKIRSVRITADFGGNLASAYKDRCVQIASAFLEGAGMTIVLGDTDSSDSTLLIKGSASEHTADYRVQGDPLSRTQTIIEGASVGGNFALTSRSSGRSVPLFEGSFQGSVSPRQRIVASEVRDRIGNSPATTTTGGFGPYAAFSQSGFVEKIGRMVLSLWGEKRYISACIRALGHDDAGKFAAAELMTFGSEAVDPLLISYPGLDVWGKASASRILAANRESRAIPLIRAAVDERGLIIWREKLRGSGTPRSTWEYVEELRQDPVYLDMARSLRRFGGARIVQGRVLVPLRDLVAFAGGSLAVISSGFGDAFDLNDTDDGYHTSRETQFVLQADGKMWEGTANSRKIVSNRRPVLLPDPVVPLLWDRSDKYAPGYFGTGYLLYVSAATAKTLLGLDLKMDGANQTVTASAISMNRSHTISVLPDSVWLVENWPREGSGGIKVFPYDVKEPAVKRPVRK